jgi:hypothetical protein
MVISVADGVFVLERLAAGGRMMICVYVFCTRFAGIFRKLLYKAGRATMTGDAIPRHRNNGWYIEYACHAE